MAPFQIKLKWTRIGGGGFGNQEIPLKFPFWLLLLLEYSDRFPASLSQNLKSTVSLQQAMDTSRQMSLSLSLARSSRIFIEVSRNVFSEGKQTVSEILSDSPQNLLEGGRLEQIKWQL